MRSTTGTFRGCGAKAAIVLIILFQKGFGTAEQVANASEKSTFVASAKVDARRLLLDHGLLTYLHDEFCASPEEH